MALVGGGGGAGPQPGPRPREGWGGTGLSRGKFLLPSQLFPLIFFSSFFQKPSSAVRSWSPSKTMGTGSTRGHKAPLTAAVGAKPTVGVGEEGGRKGTRDAPSGGLWASSGGRAPRGWASRRDPRPRLGPISGGEDIGPLCLPKPSTSGLPWLKRCSERPAGPGCSGGGLADIPVSTSVSRVWVLAGQGLDRLLGGLPPQDPGPDGQAGWRWPRTVCALPPSPSVGCGELGFWGPHVYTAALIKCLPEGCWTQDVGHSSSASFLPTWKLRGLAPVAPQKPTLSVGHPQMPSDGEAWLDGQQGASASAPAGQMGGGESHRTWGAWAGQGPGLESRAPVTGSVCIGEGEGRAQPRPPGCCRWTQGGRQGGWRASWARDRLPGSRAAAGARGRPLAEPSQRGRRSLAWLQTQASPMGPCRGSGRAGSGPRTRHNPPFVPVAAWSLRAKRK